MGRTHCTLAIAALAALLVSAPRLEAKAPHQAAAEQIIDGPRVESVGATSAIVAWTTNTGGSSILRYGTSTSSLTQTAESPYKKADVGGHATHRVHIDNLKPNTTYYFMVDSGQGQGTGTEAKSQIATFTTKSSGQGGEEGDSAAERQPVRILDGPRVEGVGNNWAVIAWTTNAASSSVLHYGTSPNSLSQTAQARYADTEGAAQQTHRVRVSNLQPNTTYYFMVDSGQGEGTGTEAKSQIAQFKTKQ
ncbi:MAG TPA: fibronectin type III domain-containing protein [Terriglobales bacterium]|nr:fibronectin type III domain-containing protein [Terriglobales bacterium]